MFCQYCGRQLQEGEVCRCRENAEASAQPQNNQSQPEQSQVAAQAQRLVEQTRQKAQETVQAVRQSGISQCLKELVISLWKNPSEALREAYETENKIPQYCIGGVFLLFTLLFSLTAIAKAGLGFGASFGYACLVMLVVAAVKAIHAAWFYLFSDRRKGILDALALFCATSMQEAGCLVILFILMLFGWSNYMMILIMLAVLFITASVANYNAARVISGEKKGYQMFLLLDLILAVILFMIGRSVVMDAIERIIDNVIGNFWYW